MYTSCPQTAPARWTGSRSDLLAGDVPDGSRRYEVGGVPVQGALTGRPLLRVAVRWIRITTGALVLLYLASTIFRPKGQTLPLYDGWVGNLAYGGCALLCGLRAVTVRDRQRAGWIAITVGLVLFAAGNLVWTTVVQFMHPVPYPSAQDALFLPFYPVAYLGVGLLVRDILPAKGSRAVWLDGVIAAFGVAAIEATIVIAYVARNNVGGRFAVATNIAYPIGDLVLVAMVVAVFAVQGWRPSPRWWALGAGLVLFAVADSVYVVRVLSNTYVTGAPLDALWMFGTFFMATAAWQTGAYKPARTIQPVVVPAIFVVTSLTIVVYATNRRVLPLGVALATATLVLGIVRMAFAYRQLRTLAETRREARTDELTGLANRRLFYETLGACLTPGSGRERLAVLMIDLDRFKEINDSLGHHVGDEVLRQLGPRLSTVVEPSATVARLGGDEFGLLIAPLDDPATATYVAERVRDVLQTRFMLETITLRVDASIGIAIAPDHGTAADTLLQKADVAMYEAKRNHRAWEVYSSFRDRHTLDQLQLMEDVRDAIERHELVLYYQPKLDLGRGAVTGVEALVRWQHPERGLLTPDRFLGLFEQSGLIGPLALDVLDQALAQQARWTRSKVDLSVAVNLSPSNLSDVELPDKVAEVLERQGVPPANVVLEITEDCLMVDADQGLDVLDRLHGLGVALSVDDYGTGFSSLAYLRELPVDELKLDRAFLAAAAGDDERAVAIIRSTIELAHSLGLRIVAEGVETREALDLLAELGCDCAQGYYLGRPAPASAVFAGAPDYPRAAGGL